MLMEALRTRWVYTGLSFPSCSSNYGMHKESYLIVTTVTVLSSILLLSVAGDTGALVHSTEATDVANLLALRSVALTASSLESHLLSSSWAVINNGEGRLVLGVGVCKGGCKCGSICLLLCWRVQPKVRFPYSIVTGYTTALILTSVVAVESSTALASTNDFAVILLLGIRVGPVSNSAELIAFAVWRIRYITELSWDHVGSGPPTALLIVDLWKLESRFRGISHGSKLSKTKFSSRLNFLGGLITNSDRANYALAMLRWHGIG